MRRFAALVSFALLLSACHGPRTFDVKGRVAGFSDDGRTVFVEHEAIPGFMEAMTMPFKLAEGDSLPATLQTGDAVGFTLHVADSSWITGLTRLSDADVARSPAGETNTPTGRTGRSAVDPLAIGDAAPADLALVDHTGAPWRVGDEAGRALVVSFLYTRCPLPDYCPAMASRMARMERTATARFGDRVRFASVTLDPAFDTPPVLAAWRSRFTTAPAERWRFLTGDSVAVARAIDLFGVYSEETAPGAVDHGLTTAIVGPDGRLRRAWRDLRYADAEVLGELALLLPDSTAKR